MSGNRQQRRKGEFATVKDVAQRAGVSPGTAARVLTGSGAGVIRVGEATRQRILQIAQELNFRPNKGARLLRGRALDLVGVMLDPKPSLLSAVRVAAMEKVARANGFRLMVVHDILEEAALRKTAEDLQSWGVRGLICIHHYYPKDQTLVPSVMREYFDHLVFINQPGVGGLWSVGCAMPEVTRQLVQGLHERGKTRPVLLIGDDTWLAGKKLIEGFKLGCQEHVVRGASQRIIFTRRIGVAADTLQIPPQELPALVDRMVNRVGSDAIIVGQAAWAVQIIQELQRQGLKVPGDVAVASCEEAEICTWFTPTISAGDMRAVAVAEQAIERLLDIVSGRVTDEPATVLIPPTLHWRGSA